MRSHLGTKLCEVLMLLTYSFFCQLHVQEKTLNSQCFPSQLEPNKSKTLYYLE